MFVMAPQITQLHRTSYANLHKYEFDTCLEYSYWYVYRIRPLLDTQLFLSIKPLSMGEIWELTRFHLRSLILIDWLSSFII